MRRLLSGLVIALFGILAVSLLSAAQQGVISLANPSIPAVGSSFLEEEAGITCYTKVYAVDLIEAERAFKNVEKKTSEYIVGSVRVPGYAESHDVHVYADRTGWIVAYYLAKEPASKIIDWLDYSGGMITSTKLEDALVKVTNALSVELPYVIYYDFRYPAATKIMIITDEETGNEAETFRMRIPSDYTVHSRTWSLAVHANTKWSDSYTQGTVKIDGTELRSGRAYGKSWSIWNGSITPTQLSPDTYHTVLVRNNENHGKGTSYVGIVLIYRG